LNAPVSWVVYFGPTSDADDWCLERADMTVIGADGGKVTYSVLAGGDKLWLSKDTGLIVHLER
jgi:hypothetical protein